MQIRSPHLLAIDPSLTASGWALFSLSTGMPLAVGVIAAPGPTLALALRLAELQSAICSLFEQMELTQGDFLICEGPAPLVLNPNSALKVERVRSIFEAVARNYHLTVPGRINPRTVQAELLGMRGKQLARKEVKAWAKETVKKLYGEELKTLPQFGVRPGSFSQDIVDALLIGTLAVARLRVSVQTNLPLESIFEPKRSASRKRSATWTESDLKRLQKN